MNNLAKTSFNLLNISVLHAGPMELPVSSERKTWKNL